MLMIILFQMISVGGIPGPRSYLVQAPPGAPGSHPSPSTQSAPGGQMLETIVCHICNQQVPKHVIQQVSIIHTYFLKAVK